MSELGHYSVSKAIDVLGLGTSSVVQVPTVGLKMSPAALKSTLESLKAKGTKVLAIVAVAGTTEAGSFDPLREVASLAKEHGTWLHVDAAWAGGLIFSDAPRAKALFDGIELADSVTVDAHKSLFSPMGFGMVLYRHPHAIKPIAKTAQYIIRKDSPDLGRYSLEGSRPAQVMHLHACLAALGKQGLSRVMTHKLDTCAAFAKMIEADPNFELLQPPESDILLFRALRPGMAAAATDADSDANGTMSAEEEAAEDERREADLDLFNKQLQEAQKLQGRTFVSRTALMDPRRGAAAGPAAKPCRPGKTTVLRVVINAQVTVDNCAQTLQDLRIIAGALALDPRPLGEARTLTQAYTYPTPAPYAPPTPSHHRTRPRGPSPRMRRVAARTTWGSSRTGSCCTTRCTCRATC